MLTGESISPPSLEVYLSPGWVHLISANWADVQARFLLAQPSSVVQVGFGWAVWILIEEVPVGDEVGVFQLLG